MSESRAILDAVLSSTEPAVLATVVRVSGSAYRRPGARLLLCRDGRRVGGVSGGCLEGDIARKAWWRTENGPAVVRYDSTGDGDDAEAAFGLGCNGVVDVLLERLDPANPPAGLIAARQWVRARKSGAVARVLGGSAVGGTLTLGPDPDGVKYDLPDVLAEAVRAEAESVLDAGSSGVVEVAGTEVFIEVVRPPQSLLVCGGGFDVPPLVRQAKAVGWHVTVFDPRATAARHFAGADAVVTSVAELPLEPGGAAALVTHNFEDDKKLLPLLLRSPLVYVGALGPKRRTDRLLARADFAPTAGELDKLHAPVGLDVGAETPAEIALAIVAEVRAVAAGRRGGMLRDRHGPIHDRTFVPPTVPAEAVAACSAGALP